MPIVIYRDGEKFEFEGTTLKAVKNKYDKYKGTHSCDGCFFDDYKSGCTDRNMMPCLPVEGIREYAVKFIKAEMPKYKPFDGTKPEVQDFLLGRMIKSKDGTSRELIQYIKQYSHGNVYFNGYSAKRLFKDFVFMDGSPIGEKVEELKEAKENT